MKFVIAVIIFSVVILIHELGHFLLAKKNHIEVLEFSLGMGPRIISTVKGGTRYSVKLFPLGGSCAMAGEDAEDDSPGTFNSAPVWGRIAVVAAGPIFNFLLAFVLSVIIVGCMGYDPATVLEVTQNSAAEKAGLKKGDVITEYQGYHIDLGKDLYVYSYLNELKEGQNPPPVSEARRRRRICWRSPHRMPLKHKRYRLSQSGCSEKRKGLPPIQKAARPRFQYPDVPARKDRNDGLPSASSCCKNNTEPRMSG